MEQATTQNQTVNQTIDQQYDDILKTQLARRLNRAPTRSEIVNGDNDSDLVNETLWELICQLSADIALIKQKIGL